MKSRTIQQYIWLVNTLRQHKRLTLEEINRLWIEDRVSDGTPLSRVSFYRYKDYVFSMFGIIIECDTDHGYKYFIANPEVLADGSMEHWMLSTLTVNGVLNDSAAVKERVVLEKVPAGEEFLRTIIQAIKLDRRLVMGYRKFGTEGYEKVVCPYALKLFHQRWYLLALRSAALDQRSLATSGTQEERSQGENNENQMRIYALDRMTMVGMTDDVFVMPADFSPQAYFAEYFGVLTNDTPLAHVIVRAHKWMPNYLRTLPLHHSQRELESTPDYTDFSFDIRPTSDFLGELLRHSEGIEVLQPPDLREKMRQMIAEMLKKY